MPSVLYVYNMLPVIGAGDRFTDISIVPHPKGFRKVVEKVLQLRKGPLCETDTPDTGEVARSARGGALSAKLTEGETFS